MMTAIVIDNFFNNFKDVEKFAGSLKYTHSGDGRWPGYRSEPIHKINYDFFFTQNVKALYPMNYRSIHNARMFFQTIPFEGSGFIHQDDNEISSIIYRGGKAGGTAYMNQNNTLLIDTRTYHTRKILWKSW